MSFSSLLPRRGRSAFAVLGAAALFLVSAPALADDIANSLDASVDATAEVMPLNVGGANGTTTLYVVNRNEAGGENGCNFQGSETLTIALSSSNPTVATVSPSSLTFGGCGQVKTVTVTPLTTGSTTISASQTSNNTGGLFTLSTAAFTVNVAPPANTAPVVSVSGVAAGGSYAKGSVPAATCTVTDAEDGSSSFAATLGVVTGLYASDGIGSRTASCSYTDGGGLTASSSVTYSIVDPTAPVITYDLSPASPDGSNGWYQGNVTLTWHVSDTDSPNSLQTSGCADQNITADQAETTYSCSATSAGGSSGPVAVSIKRDGAAPTLTDLGPTTAPDGDNGWYALITQKLSAT